MIGFGTIRKASLGTARWILGTCFEWRSSADKGSLEPLQRSWSFRAIVWLNTREDQTIGRRDDD